VAYAGKRGIKIMRQTRTRSITALAGILFCSSAALSGTGVIGSWKCQSDDIVFEWTISPDGQADVAKDKYGFTLSLINCSQYGNNDGVKIDCDKLQPTLSPFDLPFHGHKLIAKISDVHGEPIWDFRMWREPILWPDETLIEVEFDEIGVKSIRINNYRGDIYFTMHRDYSNWRFVTSRQLTREEAKHFQIMFPQDKDKMPTRSVVSSSSGVSVRVN
jgi:hypothetical protein